MTKDEIPCHKCGKPVDIADLPHGGPAYCAQCCLEHDINEEHWAGMKHDVTNCPTCVNRTKGVKP